MIFSSSTRKRRRQRGFSISELIVAAAVASTVAAAAVVSVVSYQRSLNAIEDSATMQQEQTRLLDFIALDLRRATNLVNTTVTSTNLLELELPTYSTNPTFSNNRVTYSSEVTRVRYYKSGGDVIREQQQGSNPAVKIKVARGVGEFDISLPSNVGGLLETKITFEPKFRLRGANRPSAREGSAVISRTWLRNLVITSSSTNTTN